MEQFPFWPGKDLRSEQRDPERVIGVVGFRFPGITKRTTTNCSKQ